MPIKKVIHHAKKIRHHTKRAKHVVHHHMSQPHNRLCDHIPLYKWWHEQDIHRHIHYAGMFAGLVVAAYYVMLDGIFSDVSVSTAEMISLIIF